MIKRIIQRDAECRGCSKAIKRGDIVFSTRTRMRHCKIVIFCVSCTDEIAKIMKGPVQEE